MRLAHAVDVVEFDGARVRPIDHINTILLDDHKPEYLGGQFVSTVVSSLDYERLTEFFRTGRPISERPLRFPDTTLVGVEYEPDSVAWAMRHVTDAALGDRIVIDNRDPLDLPWPAAFDLVYFQDVLHDLVDPVGALGAAWAAVRSAGRLVVLDWCLPSSPEESRSLQGAMLWGIGLDELYQGARMWTHEGFIAQFVAAGVPSPAVIDLPSGATMFVIRRD